MSAFDHACEPRSRLGAMRALLVVNPRATTTSTATADVIVGALAHELDLEVTFTTHRGHGVDLGHWALDNALDAVIAVGGDGVVNEVVNGILRDGPHAGIPALGVIPGGSANVFSRTLGIPGDPVEATGALLRSAREGRFRRIGIGHVAFDDRSRWFVVNAGLGIDARIIATMERHRRAGKAATPARYLLTTVSEYLRHRKSPPMTLSRPGALPVGDVLLAIVQNTSPWTYFGAVPIDPCPHASFETGLDVFAVRSLGPVATARAATRMLTRLGGGSSRAGRGTIVVWHDQATFTVRTADPSALVPIQIDGEGLGDTADATFTSHPGALLVMGSQ
jgi:diacylglycerol kinase family enzyme